MGRLYRGPGLRIAVSLKCLPHETKENKSWYDKIRNMDANLVFAYIAFGFFVLVLIYAACTSILNEVERRARVHDEMLLPH